MPQNKISILSTRPLPASLIDQAGAQGIDVNVQSFIETTPIQSVEVQQEIEQALLQSAVIVFTSMSAVEAVAEYVENDAPDWNIYCIGETTQKLAKKYFGENAVAGTADSAAALANLIVEEDYTDEVIFFCGDQRRDELPEILQEHDIMVNEIVVYQTIATPHKLNRVYNGILFFSPSAVHSFFSANKPDDQTTLFAIGDTTASALKKFSSARILTSNKPGKENLLEKAINYFIKNER